MSSIDRRVVELEFDNKQFENGIKDTLSSLDALKKGLTLDGATSGLENLNAAGKNFSLEGMASSLDNISGKFGALGAVGFAVIQRLTDGAIDFAQRIAGMVLDPLVAGGKRRALNIEQAKFQFRGLGMDVEASMESARLAVTGTAYGLDAAAKAAGQFGASGLRAGDDMTSALRAIAGVAAMTNSEYDDIANVFTKVAGNGRVMGDDLLRMSSRGLNAAATLAKAMNVTEEEVRKMVTEGKVDFETFYKAMDEAFGANATKANETYTGSLANLRAALSRIGAGFFTTFLEQQRDLFNALSPAIDDVGKALGPVIEMMTNVTGAVTERMITALNSMDFSKLSLVTEPLLGIIKNVFAALQSILGPIKDAFRQIFPPTSIEQIGAVLSAIESFTETIKMGAESAENLRRTFAGVFAIFSIGWSVIKAVTVFLLDLFGVASNGSGGFLVATANIGDFLVALDQAIKNGEGLTNFFRVLGNVIKVPLGFLIDLGRALLTVFDFDVPSVEGLSSALEPLGRLGELLAAGWSRLVEVLKTVGEVFSPITNVMGEFFSKFGSMVADAFSTLDFTEVLETIRTGFLGALVLLLRRFVKNMGSGMGSAISQLTMPFQKLTFTLNTMQTTLRAMTLMQIAIAVGILAASVLALSKIDPVGLTRALTAMSVMFTQLFVALKMFVMVGGVPGLIAVGAGLILFATAIRVLTSSVKALAELSWEELAKGLTGVAVLVGALTLAVKGMAGHTGGMISAGAGLLLLSAGIKVLASAVTDLSDISWEEMARGLVGVGTLLGALILFTKFSSANAGAVGQGAALILLATGIKILASAVTDFADLSWEGIAKGLVSVSAILAAFAIFSQTVGDPVRLIASGTALILVASAMKILASAMGDFAGLEWEEIAKGLTSMASALVLIVAALNLMPPNTLASATALVAVSVALNLIALAMGQMGGMSWDEIARGLVTLASSLAIIVVAMIGMTSALPGAAATLVVAAALAMLTPALLILGGMSWGAIARGLTTLAAVFVIFGVAGLLLAPVVPVLIGLGIAVALLGVGMLAAGAGTAALAAGLTALAVAGAAGTAALVALIAGLFGLLPTIATQIGLALVAFANVIATAGPAMFDAMSAVLGAILRTIREHMPEIIALFTHMVLQLLQSMVQIMPQMSNAALTIMFAILSAMQTRVPDIISAMNYLIIAVLKEMAKGVPGVTKAAVNLMLAFLSSINKYIGKLVIAGTNIIISLIRGISDNMVRIADAGMKAVISFINGVANAIRGNTPALHAAGRNLASAIIDGMTGGLASMVGRVASSAGSLATTALNSAKSVLAARSPSKEFEKIGKWSAEGFANGLVGGREGVISAWKVTTDLLKSAMESSVDNINKLQDKLSKLNEAQTKDVDAIQKTQRALLQARIEYQRSNDALQEMNVNLREKKNILKGLGVEYDRYTIRLGKAEQRLKDATQTRNDYRNMIKDQYTDLPNIDKDTNVTDYVNQLKYANADIVRFGEILQNLKRKGLNDEMYKELLSKGPSILPFIEELSRSKTALDQVNKLSTGLANQAKILGMNASNELYQAGVESARGLVRGLSSERAAIRETMGRIARDIVAQLRHTLRIRSPSKVMSDLGGSTIQGMVVGMKKAAPLIDKATADIGEGAIVAMKNSMSDMVDLLAVDMNLNPTIKPVLDLSAFHKEASVIGSTLSKQQISLSDVYSQAKYASLGYQQNKSAELAKTTSDTLSPEPGFIFNQYNNSPKALSSAEIYRQTKNQLSITKGALTTNATENT